MEAFAKNQFSQLDGDNSKASAYPASEASYFRRRYGSDDLKQLCDCHQMASFMRYCRPGMRKQLSRIVINIQRMKCDDYPGLKPGRHAIILSALAENLRLYEQKSWRSLRWNNHYRQALKIVRQDVLDLIKAFEPGFLKPISIGDVAESGVIVRNHSKNAGYVVFETGMRSKGENLSYALEWCQANRLAILARGSYDIAAVIAHRSSNSKIVDWEGARFRARCRIVLMQDLRCQLMDGRFAVPFNALFDHMEWAEGGMTHDDVQTWVNTARLNYDRFYSSDYSKFDTSQSDWLIEDVFHHVIRPAFGELSEEDEQWFEVMVNSYIHKEIHSFDGTHYVHKGNISGSIWTYTMNTLINQVMDVTSQLMQGCDPYNFHSLKCGDDNLTYYKGTEPFNVALHCQLIERYFGVKTKIEGKDHGFKGDDPTFLSRTWTLTGATRPIYEVIWNLMYPERFRDYFKAGVSPEKAVALVLMSAVLEQPRTMYAWFDVNLIKKDAGVYGDKNDIYRRLSAMGSGFRTSWINFAFNGQFKVKPVKRRRQRHPILLKIA